jgi:hypothetical protein
VTRSGTGVVVGVRYQQPSFKHFVSRFLDGRSHHPGGGCAIGRPSSAEEGTNNVQRSMPIPLP